jgi:hypothetical protein
MPILRLTEFTEKVRQVVALRESGELRHVI